MLLASTAAWSVAHMLLRQASRAGMQRATSCMQACASTGRAAASRQARQNACLQAIVSRHAGHCVALSHAEHQMPAEHQKLTRQQLPSIAPELVRYALAHAPLDLLHLLLAVGLKICCAAPKHVPPLCHAPLLALHLQERQHVHRRTLSKRDMADLPHTPNCRMHDA